MGYVMIRTKIRAKWQGQSVKCFMVSYAKNHVADTYRMYNPATNRIILSLDVRWADWKWPDPTRQLGVINRVPGIETPEFTDDIAPDTKPKVESGGMTHPSTRLKNDPISLCIEVEPEEET